MKPTMTPSQLLANITSLSGPDNIVRGTREVMNALDAVAEDWMTFEGFTNYRGPSGAWRVCALTPRGKR